MMCLSSHVNVYACTFFPGKKAGGGFLWRKYWVTGNVLGRDYGINMPNREVTGTTGFIYLVIKLLIHLIGSLDFFGHHSCIFADTFEFRPFS
jgi:hypothetical protein